MILLIFFLDLINRGHSGEIAFSCDLVGLNLCGWKLGQNVSAVYNDEISALPSAEQVKMLCGFQQDFQSCYKDKLVGCDNNMVYITTFATTQKTVEYLCGEGNADVIKHNKCWTKDIVHNTSNECYNDHVQAVQQQLKKSRGTEQDMLDGVWCRILNTSKSCMYDTVLDNCGSAAADVVSAMMTKVFENLSTFMRCDSGILGEVNSTLPSVSEEPPILVIHSACLSRASLSLSICSYVEVLILLLSVICCMYM